MKKNLKYLIFSSQKVLKTSNITYRFFKSKLMIRATYLIYIPNRYPSRILLMITISGITYYRWGKNRSFEMNLMGGCERWDYLSSVEMSKMLGFIEYIPRKRALLRNEVVQLGGWLFYAPDKNKQVEGATSSWISYKLWMWNGNPLTGSSLDFRI